MEEKEYLTILSTSRVGVEVRGKLSRCISRLPIAAHLRGLIVFVCVISNSLGSYFRSSFARLSCSHAYFVSYSGRSLVSLFAGLLLRLGRVTPSPARPLPVQIRNKKEKIALPFSQLLSVIRRVLAEAFLQTKQKKKQGSSAFSMTHSSALNLPLSLLPKFHRRNSSRRHLLS